MRVVISQSRVKPGFHTGNSSNTIPASQALHITVKGLHQALGWAQAHRFGLPYNQILGKYFCKFWFRERTWNFREWTQESQKQTDEGESFHGGGWIGLLEVDRQTQPQINSLRIRNSPFNSVFPVSSNIRFCTCQGLLSVEFVYMFKLVMQVTGEHLLCLWCSMRWLTTQGPWASGCTNNSSCNSFFNHQFTVSREGKAMLHLMYGFLISTEGNSHNWSL